MLPYTEKPVDLAYSGPLIPVRIGIPKWPSIETVGIIDTGAVCSMIHTDLVGQLGLIPAGTTRVSTLTVGVLECPQYRIRLEFPQGVYVDVVAATSTWQREDYKCIIGRDALKHGILMYNGLTNSFALVF